MRLGRKKVERNKEKTNCEERVKKEREKERNVITRSFIAHTPRRRKKLRERIEMRMHVTCKGGKESSLK